MIVRKLELLREQYRREVQESVDMIEAGADFGRYSKGRGDAFALAISMLDNVLDDMRGE